MKFLSALVWVESNEGKPLQRQMALSNFIAFAASLLGLVALIFEIHPTRVEDWGIAVFDSFTLTMTGLLALLIYWLGWHRASKIVVALVLINTIQVNHIVAHDASDLVYLWYPYGVAVASIIPQLIFSYQHERKWLLLSVAIYFLHMLFMYDLVMIYADENIQILSVIQANRIFYSLIPFLLFLFLNGAVFYLILLNGVFEKRLSSSNRELTAARDELAYSNENLQTLNEAYKATNEELYQQRQKLETTIEELQTTQEQLIHSEKMASLGTLTSGIAHEINNPINYIYNGSLAIQTILEERDKESLNELRPYLEAIHTGISRATGIIKSLNRYNRSEALPHAHCPLHEILENGLTMLYNKYKNRIAIKRLFNINPIYVWGNEGQLHQAFVNVLDNAIEAIQNKGTIKVLTGREDSMAKVVITDTGHGISKKNLKHIFDPFFTTREPGKGTGLGLSIVYRIFYEHNGSIQYESEPGKGTHCIIKIPVDQVS